MEREDQFIPHVAVSDGLAAMKFYVEVFGGAQGNVTMGQDGKRLMHGEVALDGHLLFVSDEYDEDEGGTLQTPDKLGGRSVRITLMVDDADAVMARATDRGSTLIMPAQDMFWGGRYGKFIDPFGHEWGINQELTKLTAEEEQRRTDEFMGKDKN